MLGGRMTCTNDKRQRTSTRNPDYVYDDSIEIEDSDTSPDYNLAWRKVFYPSNFCSATVRGVWNAYKQAPYPCHICGRPLITAGTTSKLSIDHLEPVATHFNRIGYTMTPSNRAAWYNNISNLKLVHSDCNSSRGSDGVVFDLKKVSIANTKG